MLPPIPYFILSRRQTKYGFYGYSYLGNSLYGNSLIYLPNTGGSKQWGAQDGVMACMWRGVSFHMPQTAQMTMAADLMMQYHTQCLWLLPDISLLRTADPWKNNTLTKTTNAHTFKMPTVTYSHEHSQNVLWSFWILAHLSYINKLTNKQMVSVCRKVACSVWSAEQWISG